MSDLMLLDGPVGTELLRHGLRGTERAWMAHAAITAPSLLAAVHRAYADAGASIHTANTFRTTRAALGSDWETYLDASVSIARQSVPPHCRVAGAIAPVEDCYRPDLSPLDPRPHHRELARALHRAGADLLLCETFPHVPEALVAVEEAVATGLETWVAFTGGPHTTLLTPEQVREGAVAAVDRGASAVLVNCTPSADTLPFIQALTDLGSGLTVPVGAYANAGRPDDGFGWQTSDEGPARYARCATEWLEAGVTILGSCCGTSPAHILAIRTMIDDRSRGDSSQ